MSGSSCEENETHGPKVGVKLDLEQANFIIQRHFPSFQATKITHINRGYNNRVYIVDVSSSSSKNGCSTPGENSFILRLSGRFWTRYKTENEVCAIQYMRKHGGIPVPKIYGYCVDKEKSGVDREYILMERVKGEPMENLWNDLNVDEKKHLLDQVAEILGKVQSITFDKIGSFQFKSESIGSSLGIGIIPDEDIKEPKHVVGIGKGVEFDEGPFETYLEYFKSTSETEIQHLRECAFLKESEGHERRLRRIENFVGAFEKLETVPEGIDKEALENVPFVFLHGDLEHYNIMVDRDTLNITSVIDWEFAGSYPIDEEWFTGFGFVKADTSECRVFSDGQNTLAKSEPEEDHLLRDYFFSMVKQNGVITPDEIPGHMIRAELYYFKGYISPWWLREARDPIPESHYEERQKACERVDAILDKYGF